MTRQTFVRKLRKIGDLPVPRGHVRHNKGATGYFFSRDKLAVVRAFLERELGVQGFTDQFYVGDNWHFKAMSPFRSVYLFDVHKEDFVSVEILSFPG